MRRFNANWAKGLGNIVYCAVVFTFIAPSGVAQVKVSTDESPIPPPDFANGFNPAPFGMAHKPVLSFRLGALPVFLEQMTLGQVQAAIGGGRIFEQGDAGDHILWLCYTVNDPKSWQRIWIVSGGEMGGPEHLILTVTAVIVPAEPSIPKSCPTLDPRFRPLLLEHDIRLGMSAAEVVKRLGRPTIVRGDLMTFSYSKPVDASDPVLGSRATELAKDQFTIGNTLTVRIADGRVIELNAERVTSS